MSIPAPPYVYHQASPLGSNSNAKTHHLQDGDDEPVGESPWSSQNPQICIPELALWLNEAWYSGFNEGMDNYGDQFNVLTGEKPTVVVLSADEADLILKRIDNDCPEAALLRSKAAKILAAAEVKSAAA